MQEKLQILGISDSLRLNSINTGLLRAAQQLMPERMSLEIADISQIPLYNDDLF